MSPFKLLEKGKAPTFLEATFANGVLKLLNALIRIRVAPAAAGKFVVTEDSIVLDLTPMSAAQQAAQILALQKTTAAQQAQINALIASLKTATITCTDGSVVLVLTKLP